MAWRARVVRARTQRPEAYNSSTASGVGESTTSVSPASYQSIATTNESVNKSVSHVSITRRLMPTPQTSTSPTMRAIRSPMADSCTRAMGQASTPRSRSARRLALMRPLAVIRNQRLKTRGISVARVPAMNKSASPLTALAATSPREKASAVSMACPSRMAGSTTAVFITMPASEPSSSSPATWRKYGRTLHRNRIMAP